MRHTLTTQLLLAFLIFCCAAIILGVYSYFLSVLANRNLPISKDWRAVEGMSGAACVWLLLAPLITCCCGGFAFWAIISIIVEFLFLAAFIAIAVLTRHGAGSCSGIVNTPLGIGPSDSQAQGYGANGFGFGAGQTATYEPRLHLACRLNTAAFAVAIIGAFLFALDLFVLHMIRQNRKKESFRNEYDTTAKKERRGYGFFNRRNKQPKHVDNTYVAQPGTSTLAKDDYGEKNVGYSAPVGTATHAPYYEAGAGSANPYTKDV